jgi:ABC-2 type transport system permease protein
MNAIWAVFRREVGVYFRSPIAYAIAFGILLFMGVLFNGLLVQANGQAPATPTFVPGIVPGLLTFLTFLIAPLLTMRLLAEEQREGTIEVLMTLPMSERAFVVGKFLAAWFYFTVLLALTLVYVLIIASIGVPDWGLVGSAYLGAWLYGGAVLAITMIWSAVTEDQIVAAFLGAATVLVLFLAESAATALSGQQGAIQGLSEVIRQLGLQSHYDSTLANGIIRGEDIAYFILMMFGALFITTRLIEIRRWRA